jgi:hypothetical protein
MPAKIIKIGRQCQSVGDLVRSSSRSGPFVYDDDR